MGEHLVKTTVGVRSLALPLECDNHKTDEDIDHEEGENDDVDHVEEEDVFSVVVNGTHIFVI